MRPPSTHHTGVLNGDLRLTAIPVTLRDNLHLQAVCAPAGIGINLRLDREARAWLRRWLDETDNPSPIT